MSKMPFLKIHFRAMAQATEQKERVGQAFVFATGTDEITVEETKGHFGNPILIFEAELKKASDMKNFIGRLDEAGLLEQLEKETDSRLDQDCNFYFRLDKQKAFSEELALAETKDVIAVNIKIAAYPARRENAQSALTQWFSTC